MTNCKKRGFSDLFRLRQKKHAIACALTRAVNKKGLAIKNSFKREKEGSSDCMKATSSVPR